MRQRPSTPALAMKAEVMSDARYRGDEPRLPFSGSPGGKGRHAGPRDLPAAESGCAALTPVDTKDALDTSSRNSLYKDPL